MEKLMSASEIAALRLPGLPTTKAAILAMAKREKWYFEEATGIGGTKRVFELPTRYLSAEIDGERHSAAEIAAMKLPGLPTTKGKVIARATSESWPYVEAKGVGGTRKLYEVPAKYLSKQGQQAEPTLAPVVGHIAGQAGGRVDTAKLELAIRALTEWEQERGLKVAEERRPAVIAILYDYLQGAEDDSTEALAVVFRALG